MSLSAHSGRTAVVSAVAGLMLVSISSATPTASAASRVVRAGHAVKAADHRLVVKAHSAARCKHRCTKRRRAVQHAGGHLNASARRMSRTVQATSTPGAPGKAAPVITVKGEKLTWHRVHRIKHYVLARMVPGQLTAYSIVKGTHVRPPAVPGVTVRYSVRTAVASSPWAPEVSIAYPGPVAAAPSTAPPGSRPVDAPAVTVSGQTLTWSPVAKVNDYVVVVRTPDRDVYTVVSGTTFTPPATPGKPATTSVRTAHDGSAWAPEQPVGTPAPAAPAPAPAAAPAAAGPAAPLGFQFGINSGSSALYQLGAARPVGAKHARMEFDISTPVSAIGPTLESYARAGIQPLLMAGFENRTPSQPEIQNVARWAAAFGPGGSWWAGKGIPVSLQIANIEFGNETNNPYQFSTGSRGSDWWTDPVFLQRAKEYALRLKDAGIAVRAANASVGLLGIADQYSGHTTWVDSMFQAVPDLGSYVSGWTVHPYGQSWSTPMDTMIASLRAHGAPDRPLYATEWGLSTDNGRCLSDNYGWNACMGYGEAATILDSVVAEMRARYGTRLAAIYLYSLSDLKPSGSSSDREQYFGALRNDRSEKGPYTAVVKRLLAGSS